MLTYILFFVGFIFLIKGASLLVDGASSLAKRWGLSDMIIGLTVVAIGTSAPELFINILANLRGADNLSFSNIIGANILNILFVLGIAALIYPLIIKKETVWKEIPFCLLAPTILFYLANDHWFNRSSLSILSRPDGLVMIAFFLFFIFYAVFIARSRKHPKIEHKKHPFALAIPMIILGIVGLFFGGQWVIQGAIAISRTLGMSESAIGLTIISFGTTLPEITAAIVAALKKKTDIVIGTIIGSNVFNILLILGLSAIIKPIIFDPALNIDIVLYGLFTLLLFFSLLVSKRYFRQFLKDKHYSLGRWGGAAFVTAYVLYVFSVMIRN
jgi:cation:H+ antiporter